MLHLSTGTIFQQMNQRTLRNELIQLSAEAHIAYEIENVLNDMIDTIDVRLLPFYFSFLYS
jgi:hypothetical protein